MRIDIQAISDIGGERPNNEDMLLVGHEYVRNGALQRQYNIKTHTRLAAMVADGMGGHEGGEYASELALHRFEKFLDSLPPELTTDRLHVLVDQWVEESHNVINSGGANPELLSMGTTLSGCFIYERKLYWLNIGDSRIYLCRDGILRQISTDHTLRNLMHDSTIPSNVIYNCLGGGGVEVFCNFDELPIYDNDCFLICSDGLSDAVPEEDLRQLLTDNAPVGEFVNKAYDNGASDNISLIILKT